MKRLRNFGNELWRIIRGIAKIIVDLVLGLAVLLIGTGIIFTMGFGVWLISGAPGVERYFNSLNGQK